MPKSFAICFIITPGSQLRATCAAFAAAIAPVHFVGDPVGRFLTGAISQMGKRRLSLLASMSAVFWPAGRRLEPHGAHQSVTGIAWFHREAEIVNPAGTHPHRRRRGTQGHGTRTRSRRWIRAQQADATRRPRDPAEARNPGSARRGRRAPLEIHRSGVAGREPTE